MNPNIPAPSNPARRSRLRLALKICAGGGLVFLLALLLGLGIPILRECFRPIAPPSFEDAARSLLIRADSQTPVTILTPGTASTRNASLTHKTTTAISSTTPSSTTLHFKQFIPNSPNLPAKLRPRQSALNTQFDNLLSEIEKYEKNKRILSYEEARKRLDQIEKQKKAIWSEIIEINGDTFPMEGWTGEVLRRHKEYMKWEMSAEAEINIKGQKWIEAGSFSKRILDMNRFEWVNRQFINSKTPIDQPIFKSDYYKENTQDWDRMMGCYRQVGGWDGYTSVVSAVFSRQKEKIFDVLGHVEYSTRAALRGR